MSRVLKRGLALGLLAFVLATSAMAAGDTSTQSIKQIMGSNFQHLSRILTSLITGHYGEVASDVQVINDHANHLTQNIPDFVKGKELRQLFLSYAFNLKTTSANLILVSKTLSKKEAPKTTGKDGVDYLRVVAAQHFGQMISACVLCHNQFRHNPVP